VVPLREAARGLGNAAPEVGLAFRSTYLVVSRGDISLVEVVIALDVTVGR
jgi:hypothetical protein